MNVKDTVASIITRADADPSGDKLDKLVDGIGKLVTRIEAIEAATKSVVVKADAEPSLTDNKDGEKLDKVLAHLDSLHSKHDELKTSCDSLHTKHDALAEKHDGLAKRMDAFEAKGKEAENIEKSGEPTPVMADAAKGGEELQKGSETEEKALATEREQNGLKRNDAAVEPSSTMMDSVNTEMGRMREYIAKLERSIPKEMPDDERNKFVEAQAKAERIAQAFGDSAGAPRWLNGETLHNYQRRLLSKYKGHSTAWKEKDLAKLHDSVLDVAETQIYADAWTAATKPASIEGQPLREVKTSDRTGRIISSFIGDAEACWGPFKLPRRHVTGFTPPPPPPVVVRQQ